MKNQKEPSGMVCRAICNDGVRDTILSGHFWLGRRNEWYDAIYNEIKSLIENETWTLVDRPYDKNVIGCRTVLRNKYLANGKLERRKARAVVKGFSQRMGVDFHDTFVARLSSLRTLMAAAVEQNKKIAQLDVTAAYLNGSMDTLVYRKCCEKCSKRS